MSDLIFLLNDGRKIPASTCTCGGCGREWFVPAMSDEWMPNFCCYCGMRFVKLTVDGETREYKGSPVPDSHNEE